MNFSWFISKRIALSNENKSEKSLSNIIIKIGQLAVILGIVISILTLSFGLGIKKGIKEKLADFNGHITIKSLDSNNSYNSSILNQNTIELNEIKKLPFIASIQSYASKSGIIRTDTDFDGVILKGVGTNFDSERFEKFIVEGDIPKYKENEISNEVILSKRIANRLNLKVGTSFVMFFLKDDEKPIYRRFTISGLFQTDIKQLDDAFVIGDIKHIQRLNNWENKEIGGYDIFIKDIEQLDNLAPEVNNLSGFNNTTETATQTFASISEWIKIFDKNILVILVIIFIVVVINIIMVLLILIIERTNSIGLLKTIGASNKQIRQIFINYTLIIMLPGVIIGIISSLLILYIQKYFGVIKMNADSYYISVVPVYINYLQILGIAIGLLIISGISLLLPSYLISKISPIKAIKFQ